MATERKEADESHREKEPNEANDFRSGKVTVWHFELRMRTKSDVRRRVILLLGDDNQQSR